MKYEIFVQLKKLAGYWKMHLQVLDLFKSHMKLNQYKQCNTYKLLYFKKLDILLLITKITKFQILGPRRAIVSVPLNADLRWVPLKIRLLMWTEVFKGH